MRATATPQCLQCNSNNTSLWIHGTTTHGKGPGGNPHTRGPHYFMPLLNSTTSMKILIMDLAPPAQDTDAAGGGELTNRTMRDTGWRM